MIGNTFYLNWEIELIAKLQGAFSSIAPTFSKVFSAFGSEIVLVGIILYIYLAYDKKIGRKIMINTVIGLELGCAIKNVFQRRRPYMDTDKVKCLIPVDNSADVNDLIAQGFSFPSLHSFNITCITGSLYKYIKTRTLLVFAIAMSFFVGISRIVTANHFPTDVIAGWLLGIISIELVNFLQDKIEKRKLYIFLSIVMSFGFLFCKSNDFFSGYGIMIGFFIGDLIEEKYIKFENTKSIVKTIARIILAAALFLAFCEGSKLLVNETFQETLTLPAFIFRTFRYALGTFVACGISPMIYKYNILKINK